MTHVGLAVVPRRDAERRLNVPLQDFKKWENASTYILRKQSCFQVGKYDGRMYDYPPPDPGALGDRIGA